jgi:hypothetical protein
LQARLSALRPGEEKKSVTFCREALAQALKAFEFAEGTNTDDRFVTPYRDFVRAYLFIGEALVQGSLSPVPIRFEAWEVRFYDEYFRQVAARIVIEPGR